LAGRYNLKRSEGNVYDHRFDGVEFTYGKDVKVVAGYGKANARKYDEVAYGEVATKFGMVDAAVNYWNFKDDKNGGTAPLMVEKEIWTAAINMPVAKDLKFGAMYLKGDEQKGYDDDGYVLTLAYKGAKASVPGSWGLEAKLYDQPAATYVDHTMDGLEDAFLNEIADNGKMDGFEGYSLTATYGLAKNIVAKVQYFDLEAKEGKHDAETLWGQVVFTF